MIENTDGVTILSGVYIIKNLINKKIYIGSANNLREKFKTYIPQLNHKNFRVEEINLDILKYGIENFELEELTTCTHEISYLVERYYIKKYDAIKKGYNKINAPRNKKGSSKLKIIAQNKASQEELEICSMMECFMSDTFDYANENTTYVISVFNLFKVLHYNFEGKRMYWVFEIFRRLDITTFLKDEETETFYQVSGNQIYNWFRWGDFKSDNKIESKIKARLSVLNFDNTFIECTKFKGNKKDIDTEGMLVDIEEFKNKNTIIDATYKQQYIKNDCQYTKYFYED
ncbi:GIY-YIG nuclease family protein [Clostridium botulinum]|uniref:GIY-YIG nuclease family protein n=1 Tax=Clostridium botulinum TaxID=1491 RepID=UPI0022474368|nr:GIY-YIG nuclease family protein [Clostridium botulinum]UZP04846.1 GIY-YIG nuclease family protein [Clostridium botulinum]UZP08257.1 GIY-YIG nuclease family protein [Clostridium botulinum]UZP11585.1 GIY-YIG nuclease family protein [Clostridium botulinum]